MDQQNRRGIVRRATHRALVLGGSGFLTLVVFLVLPVIQSITEDFPEAIDTLQVDSFEQPDLVEPEPEEPEPEPEPEEETPELEAEPASPDLDTLELSLQANLGGGFGAGEFQVDLGGLIGGGSGGLTGLDDLDRKPRPMSQPSPVMSAKVRAATPGSAKIKFIVDERGRVNQAKVARSSDPVFERPALEAVRKWRFEPATRDGKPVKFPYSVTVTFPKP